MCNFTKETKKQIQKVTQNYSTCTGRTVCDTHVRIQRRRAGRKRRNAERGGADPKRTGDFISFLVPVGHYSRKRKSVKSAPIRP